MQQIWDWVPPIFAGHGFSRWSWFTFSHVNDIFQWQALLLNDFTLENQISESQISGQLKFICL